MDMDWIRTIIELISLLGRLKNSDYKYLCEIDGNCCTRHQKKQKKQNSEHLLRVGGL